MWSIGLQLWTNVWHFTLLAICLQLFRFDRTKMKRSLANPRAMNKPTGSNNSLAKKVPIKLSEQRGTSIQKISQVSIQVDSHDHHKFEQKYRNKNLNALPTQMLVTLSALTTIDISYNKLTDSQIELIMNSCTKLSSLCIQGNLSTLIPSAISKLKLLLNFKHDWTKLNPHDDFEPPARLERTKEIATKPQIVIKVNKIVGLDFTRYCQYVLQVSIDRNFKEKVQKCDLTPFAKNNMMKCMEEMMGKSKEKQRLAPIQEGQERSIIPGCFGAFGFDQPKKRQEKYRDDTTSESGTSTIRIEDIRDITDKEMSRTTANDIRNEQQEFYSSPSHPLHQLFANFDRNPHAPAEIDGLLLRGYNPNLYDNNGLSPFHMCVINKQRKGLDYLVQISSNNPGFFDLEMPSNKEGRNLLHFCVFLKNYNFTKTLIEFGLPIDKRDGSGARIIHLVDQNIEFLILLRKLLRKKTHGARNLSILSVPQIPHQNKKWYVKHPQRQKEQSRFRITYNKNDKLLEMYESAAGIPGQKVAF